MKELRETVCRSQRVYSGLVINVRVDDVRLPDGRPARREVAEHPGAVAVLAVNESGEALLVRQYRHATGEVLLEIPAGKLDAGEQPIDCAGRELAEETGFHAARLQPLGSFFTSPGFAAEILHVFLATGLQPGEAAPDGDELLEPFFLPLAELERLAAAGQVRDAKTLAALYLYGLQGRA